MALKKIKIENFKIFEGMFELELNQGLNILVGNNEVGKSTILQAIHLALTGIINGRYLNTELTQYLFNNNIVQKYIESLRTSNPQQPPRILIELYFEESPDVAIFKGRINSDRDNDACGIAFFIELEDVTGEYTELLRTGDIKTLPIEYYDMKWMSFADGVITTKRIPVKSALVDSAMSRYQNGSDIYISRIVRQGLEAFEIVKIAQAHRQMRESFMHDESVRAINEKICLNAAITDKPISLSVELLSKNAWENSLMTCVGNVPFHHLGKGEQSSIKTKLALADKKAKKASVILMEEPENHLTHAKLNQLIANITAECKDRQVIISTHSSFVANKLGLGNLILLNNFDNEVSYMRFKYLDNSSSDVSSFFSKLAGYDTLRLVLCDKAILVEGPSDELVVQKAYRIQSNSGRLPIEDGIDVISVGTSFLRFLEIATHLKKPVAVVTDNDGDIESLESKYKKFLDLNTKTSKILISYDKANHTPSEQVIEKYNYNTLENFMLMANSLEILNQVFNKEYKTENELRIFMRNNKTDCALSIFNWGGVINFPSYIKEAIKHVSQ